jgi:mono/diheme cytochrome c family protein
MNVLRRVSAAAAALVLLTGAAFAAGDPAAGRALAERWCASCHLIGPGQAAATTEAPPFATVAARAPDALAALAAFLADPHPPMPDFSLTRQEIRDLLAYIASLKQ